MYSVSYEDNFIEPMNVKEFTYDELLRDVPLPNSVLPKVYPFENTDGKITFVNLLQLLNKFFAKFIVDLFPFLNSMLFTPDSLKADIPIVVTPLGITIFSRDEQISKACSPISVKAFEISMVFSEMQS